MRRAKTAPLAPCESRRRELINGWPEAASRAAHFLKNRRGGVVFGIPHNHDATAVRAHDVALRHRLSRVIGAFALKMALEDFGEAGSGLFVKDRNVRNA